MSYINQKIDPLPGKPFGNCKLNREPYARVLTSIVKNFEKGFVLAIDAEWGTGKTTFVKMWRQYLIDRKFSTLYFNAWENDFENDVLVALISELEELKSNNQDKKKFESVVDKAAPFVNKLIPALAKTLASRYAGDDFVNSVVNGFAEVTGEELQNEMEAYAKRKKGLTEFRESLSRFVEEVTQDKPLVFFIDELDRCRPNYAVEVLEKIKHLFSVEGIVFILSIDKEQLGHAIRGVYGSEKINAEEYLRRFIDIEYSIPEPTYNEYIEYLYTKYNFKDFFESKDRNRYNELNRDHLYFKDVVKTFFKNEKLNLRQLDKIFLHIRLTIKSVKSNNYVFPHLLFYLVYLRHLNLPLFNKIRKKTFSPQQLLVELEDNRVNTVEDGEFKFSVSIISDLLCQYINSSALYSVEDIFKKDKISEFLLETKLDRELYGRLIDSFYNQFNTSRASIDFLIKRINFTENFVEVMKDDKSINE